MTEVFSLFCWFVLQESNAHTKIEAVKLFILYRTIACPCGQATSRRWTSSRADCSCRWTSHIGCFGPRRSGMSSSVSKRRWVAGPTAYNYETGYLLHIFLSFIIIQGAKNMKEEATRALVGESVVTKYNNTTYRIDEVALDSSPKSTFPDRKTGQVSG